jgi:hypothetical protein
MPSNSSNVSYETVCEVMFHALKLTKKLYKNTNYRWLKISYCKHNEIN